MLSHWWSKHVSFTTPHIHHTKDYRLQIIEYWEPSTHVWMQLIDCNWVQSTDARVQRTDVWLQFITLKSTEHRVQSRCRCRFQFTTLQSTYESVQITKYRRWMTIHHTTEYIRQCTDNKVQTVDDNSPHFILTYSNWLDSLWLSCVQRGVLILTLLAALSSSRSLVVGLLVRLLVHLLVGWSVSFVKIVSNSY